MWFPNLYQRLLYPLVNHFVAFSPKAKRYLLRRGVDINQITTEIQSMPASLLGDLDVAPNEVEEEAETVIFTLAYLRPGKGIDTLISAYERIATNETHLVIAGDGPAEEQLRDMATGRTDITFTGFVSGEEKWSYYAAADVFVLPTRHDAWGLVINEAMYYGLPVVTTTAAGGSCVVNDEFVVPADDPDQLATTLAALRDDREYRDELGRRGAVREELFEPVTMSEAIRTAVEATAP
jgi:glycosyltransferase involved in cell wall biosynthesis